MKPDWKLLKKVLEIPTAPFHESFVRDFVFQFCEALGLRVQSDKYGNLKVVYRSGSGGKPIAFLAHMDHPGFEVTQGGTKPSVKLLGGVPDIFFHKARVVVIDEGRKVRGRVVKNLNKKSRTFQLMMKESVGKGAFGYFDLPGCRFQGTKVESKAIDNVASVAILLNLLQELVANKKPADIRCYFTRAEEVGFIGLCGAIEEGFYPRKIPVIVLEASSAKAGKVKLGSGPVLRVGDRLSIFSNELDLEARLLANQLCKQKKGFQFQRALLPGGVCEATLLALNEYKTLCLAFPLAHYHNNGAKSYACEQIDKQDYTGMLVWLFALAGKKESRGLAELKSTLHTQFKKQCSKLLKSIPH